MEPALVFEETYKISMLCLRFNGAHPFMTKDRKWVLQFIIMYGLFFIIGMNCAYNMIFINFKENDFPNACSNVVFLIVLGVVSFKYAVLMWYQKEVQAVIRLQQEYFDHSREFTAEEQAIVHDYINKGQWVSKLWLISCIVTGFMFVLKSCIDTAYSAYIGDFKLHSFNENSYPLGIDDAMGRVDVFLLVYSTFIFYGFFSGSMYTGFTPLGPIFLLNTCAQMDIVIMRVKQLFNGKRFSKEETAKELKNIVKLLQKIYSTVERINEIFQVLYELCLNTSAVMIPISLYLILESFRDGTLSLDYLSFSYTASLICFVPCYYSDKLKEKGFELQHAIYACGWENFYDKQTRVTLYIMLMRATKPLSIKTIFRTVCLDAFAEFCKQSYIIFNMMYAVLE